MTPPTPRRTKPRELPNLTARLAAIGCRSPRLRKADLHQCAAGRWLRRASDLLLKNTMSSMNSPLLLKDVGMAMTQARVQLAVMRKLHEQQFDQFIESIMREPTRKAVR